jgi:hypothetical protein
MIIAGYEYAGEKPFSNVYLTGLVRDKQGRKMSKSLGNSPEPLGLIEKFGADGVRVGLLLSASAGNDILFDEELCNQGKGFATKIWNAFRLIKGWEVADIPQPEASKVAVEWYEAKLQQTLLEIYRYLIHLAVMTQEKVKFESKQSGLIDLTSPSIVLGGANALKTIDGNNNSNYIYGMIAGDYNGDGIIDASDYTTIWNNRDIEGYFNEDTDLQGIVTTRDFNVSWNNRDKKTAVPKKP